MAFFKNRKQADAEVEQVNEYEQLDENQEQDSEEQANQPDESIDPMESSDEPEQRGMFDTGEDVQAQKDVTDMIDEVIDYFTQVDPIKLNMLERGKLSKSSFEGDVKDYIKKMVRDKDVQKQIFDGFASFVWGYDILDELIADDDISDIKIYDWNHIRIKKLGKRENCPLTFRSERHYSKFVEHVAIKNKVNISDQNAAQNFVDKESSDRAILRFNIVTGFLNSNGKYVLHIRKIPKNKMTEQQLIDVGFFTQDIADYLKTRVTGGGGFLLTGKGGSGKTTCINWLIDEIPEYYSGLVIQENEELFSNHPDMAFEHTVTNRGEGKIEYTLGDLARNGLLTDIDYFIIGEIKGGEALYLLNAIYTGAKGWASVHGASSKEAMKKLVDYIKYNSDYTQEEALEMLVHLDTVVYMENFSIREIAEVAGYDESKGDLTYKMVCENGKMLEQAKTFTYK
jgi:pilus assembly protein CpaF